MNFIINSSAFLHALKRVVHIVPTSAVIPITEMVLIRIEESQIILHTTNLHIHLIYKLPYENQSSDNEKFCIDIRSLIRYISTLADQSLTFTLESKTLTIGHTSGSAKFPLELADNFPRFPISKDTGSVNIKLSELEPMLKDLAEVATPSDGYMWTEGIYWNKNTLIASDQHALQMYHLDVEVPLPVIISRKSVLAILSAIAGKSLDYLCISFNSSITFFNTPDEQIQMTCQNIDTRYPDVNLVIPKSYKYTLTIDRQDILSKLKRVGLLSNKETNQIYFTYIQGSIEIIAIDSAAETEAREKCLCNSSLPDGYKIGFNATLLIKLLSFNNHEEVVFELNEPNKAMVIRSYNGLSMLTPIVFQH